MGGVPVNSLSMNDWEANRNALQARDRVIASLKQELADTQHELKETNRRLATIEKFLFDGSETKKSA